MKQSKFLLIFALAAFITATSQATLVAHWELDGNANDSAGSNNGVLNGDAGFVAPGQVGSHALVLDGDGDYVNMATVAPALGSSDLTITAWFYLDTTATTQFIYSARPDSSHYFNFKWDAAQQYMWLRARGGTAATTADVRGTSVIQPGQWYHVAVVWDRLDETQSKMYINGVDDTDPTLTLNRDSLLADHSWTANGNIGQWGGGGHFLDGIVDDVRIYHKALTQAEVLQLVPEPATLILLGSGMFLLRRKK